MDGPSSCVPPKGIEPSTFGTNVRRFPLERTRRADDREHDATVTAITSKQVS